jgi:hypothetical protein
MPDCTHKPGSRAQNLPRFVFGELHVWCLEPLLKRFSGCFNAPCFVRQRSHMIFRRRRTRIEIEHTTVRVSGSDLTPAVVPPAPSTAEPTLARVLEFPARETNEPTATNSVPTINPTAKETRS